MKNLLVLYYASGKIKVEKMTAAEAIMLHTYSDVERITILNITDKIIKSL